MDKINKSDSNDNLLKPEVYVTSNDDDTKDKAGDKVLQVPKPETRSQGTPGPGFYTNPAYKSSISSQVSTATGESSKTHKSKKDTDVKSGTKSATDDRSADGGKAEPPETIVESASVASNSSSRPEGHEKIVNMCLRGDWAFLDQQLRNTKRGHTSLSKREPVRIVPAITKTSQ